MKYIITESKLISTIDNFITIQFGELHHQLDGAKLTFVNDEDLVKERPVEVKSCTEP
jgi:hypothetical protein